MGKFEQLDFAKRVTIQTYLDEGKSASFIARNLNVNKSTITREIQRNRAVNKSAKCKVIVFALIVCLTEIAKLKNYAKTNVSKIVAVVPLQKNAVTRSSMIARTNFDFHMFVTAVQKRKVVQKNKLNMMELLQIIFLLP